MANWFFTPFRLPETEEPTGCIVDDQADLIIAEVYVLEGVNHGPLMACAPELLSALKSLERCVIAEGLVRTSAEDEEDFPAEPFLILMDSLKVAAAVIAKAEATNAKG